jgi:hypothetical protein
VVSLKLALLRLPKGNQVNIPELGCGYFVATQVNLGPQKAAPQSVFFAG